MLMIYAGLHRDLPAVYQDAVAKLLAQRYVEDFLPAALGVTPTRAELVQINGDMAEHGAMTISSSLFCVEPAGTVRALATLRVTPGFGTLSLTEGTLPDAHTSLQTPSYWQGLVYPRLAGFDPAKTGEARAAEVGRFAARQSGELARFVDMGALSPCESQFVSRAAIHQVLHALWHATRELAPEVVTWLLTTRGEIVTLFARLGLVLHPLFLHGIAPSPYAQRMNSMLGRMIGALPAVLDALVPGCVAQHGVQEAMRLLLLNQPRALHKSGVALPYLILNDAQLGTVIQAIGRSCERMAQSCGVALPAPLGEVMPVF